MKPTKRSMGTIRSIEGARQSSSDVPISELEKYMTSPQDARDVNRAIAVRAQQERDTARRTLAAIDALHQPDDDRHSCTCGAGWPCKTRRVLDREAT